MTDPISKSRLFARAFALVLLSIASAPSSKASAQETETLAVPYQLPSDSGLYQSLNQLPAQIRQSAPMAREMSEYHHAAGLSGVMDHDARYRSFQKSQQDLYRESMTASKSGANKYGLLSNAWTNIGPNVVTTPSTYSVGGCTNALAIDPSNPNTMYAGAAGGGVWKSVDDGANWSELTDLVIPDLAVASIAIDPNHDSTLYVGTGDGFSAADALNGSGLYKSTDAGNTWARIGSTTFTSGVVKVLVHPTKSSIVFASGFGAAQGLWRSTNAGSTWSRVYNAAGVVWDVTYGGALVNTGIFYLIDGNNFNTPSQTCGVFKSLDDGVSWTKATIGLPRGDSIERGAIVCPSGATNKVYALFSVTGSNSGDLLGLYKSTTSGVSWSKVANVPSTLFRPNSFAAGQGWYDLFLAISPNAASHDSLYLGGVEGWLNWNDTHGWQQFAGYGDLGNGNPHVDLHSFAFNPNNPTECFLGTDGGIYHSGDAASSWSSSSVGYSTLRFYHLGLDNHDSHKTYAGAQDAGIWKVVSGGSQGPQIFGGDGFQTIVDPVNPNIYYAEGPLGAIYKWSGSSWSGDLASSLEQGAWNCPFKMAPHNNFVLYTARTHVFRSTDQGLDWTSISPQLHGTETADALGLSPSSSNVIWVGMSGRVEVTSDGGTTWNTRTSGIPGATVNGIACHPTSATTALIALGSTSTSQARLMLTTDLGLTWKNVSGSGTTALPAASCNAVAIDSVNPSSTWYAATDNGIYYTLDTGKTWSIAGSGVGLAPCWDVQIHANKTTIRIATHGRGLYEAAANVLPVELDALAATPSDHGTLLTWHTDSERNNLRFDIQRSANGDAFQTIGSVAGSPGGNSSVPRSYNFLDPVHDTGEYLFQLAQVDLNGDIHYSNHVEVHYGARSFELAQNFPNPFVLGNAGTFVITRIHFYANGPASLKIYSIDGGLVRTMPQPTFENEFDFDGKDDSGAKISAGTYYYVLTTSNGQRLTNKMLVLQ